MSYVPTSRKELTKFLDKLENETIKAHKDRVEEWDKYSDIASGNKTWPGKSNPMFLANLIGPELEKKQARLTENKPSIEVMPRRPGLQATCDVLNATIKAGWDENGMESALEDLATYRGRFGCAFMSIDWDEAAAYGNGDIVLTAWDPRQVQLDPNVRRARDLDSAQYIILRTVEAVAELKARYPEVADKIPNKGDASPEYESSKRRFALSAESQHKSVVRGAIEAAQRGLGGGIVAAIPRCHVTRYWFVDPESDGDGGLKYPNGRFLIRVGDEILNWEEKSKEPQGANRYYDGRWPFEMIDNHSEPDSPLGQSDVKNLRRLQEAFNRSGNLFIRTSLDNGRPVLIVDNNAVDQNVIDQLRDAGWIVIEKMTGREVTRIPAAAPGAQLVSLMQMTQGLMGQLSGNSDDATAGKGRVELRSADQLEGLQQQGQVMLRRDARQFEQFLERLGQKWISRIFQWYTTDRLMSYVGDGQKVQTYTFEKDKLRAEIVGMARENVMREAQKAMAEGEVPEIDMADEILRQIKGAWRLFRFKVVPHSSLMTSRLQRAMLLQQLNAKAYYPGWRIMKELGFENPKELMQEAVTEQVQRQALGIQPPEAPKKGGKK